MTDPRLSRDRGFTLLELLVALVVFGLLMAGLTQGVRFGLAAWDRQARSVDAGSELDAVDRALHGLVARLDPAMAVGGRAHAAAFTSELPQLAGLANPEADLLLLVDARHRLILRWTPHLHALRFAAPPPPREEVLLDGVDRLDLAYWSRGGDGGWRESWDETDPPALIRIRVVFPAGDRRHWPDIVAAPRRDRPDG
jgi:general secretion pathway protein J